VENLNENSTQGDKAYIEQFRALCSGTPTINISDCPDLAPILMSVAAVKNGVTLTGTARLKIKESDRGTVMAEELAKFGVPVTVEEDTITVDGGHFREPSETLDGHNDHRVVMSLAVLSCLYGGENEGCEAVNKSYPDFFETVKNLPVTQFSC
jgi:3-phosphoshikimate 1-carboxyvinyltransferase